MENTGKKVFENWRGNVKNMTVFVMSCGGMKYRKTNKNVEINKLVDNYHHL